MQLDPHSRACFEQIASDLSPGDAAECISGTLHVSSSTCKSSPRRKHTKKWKKANAQHSIHGPLFAGTVAVAVVEDREEVERAAILRLQCLVRVVIVKRALREKKWMNVSATRIQALWRSRMVRKVNQWADEMIRLHDEHRDIGTMIIQVCKVFVCVCLCACTSSYALLYCSYFPTESLAALGCCETLQVTLEASKFHHNHPTCLAGLCIETEGVCRCSSRRR
jgi:hypothetical protein